MPVSIAQKIKIADRRAKVAHLKLTEPNLSSYAIAERIGGKWTHQTVLNDLSSIEEEWKQSACREFDAIKAAAVITADPTKARSTATRTSYKIKAEALDRVLRVLAGKE